MKKKGRDDKMLLEYLFVISTVLSGGLLGTGVLYLVGFDKSLKAVVSYFTQIVAMIGMILSICLMLRNYIAGKDIVNQNGFIIFGFLTLGLMISIYNAYKSQQIA